MSNRERQRRFRERQKAGRIVLAVEVDLDAVQSALLDSGALAQDTDDPDLLAKAAARVLAEWAESISVTRYERWISDRDTFAGKSNPHRKA